ncbi:MAG: hypothetical protein RJA59_1169 [Pseudomonadota bacterium]
MNTEKVTIGDRELTLAALSFKAVRLFTKSGKLQRLASVSGFPTDEQMDVVLDLVFESAARLQPDITRDWIESNASFAELPALVPVVFRLSGFIGSDPNAQSPLTIPTSGGSAGDSALSSTSPPT